ncbi:MAG: arylsulfatase [Pirellulales bacterium]
MLTGRHEFKNGVTHTILERERLAPDAVTTADVLKTAGYATGIFGKWHLGDEAAYLPDRRGFDEVYIHGCGGIGQSYAGSCGDAPSNTNIDPTLWHNGKFEKTDGYCTDLFFAQAIRWMDDARKTDKPFFAMVTPNAAHAPLVLPKSYYEHYLKRPGVSEETAKFYGMIENVDTNFGKLLAKLDEWKIAENTLVIYLGGDNGGTVGVKTFNAGLRGQKVTPYQGGVRAAAFWRWPAGKIPENATCDALTAHLDVLPTLATIAGAKTTPELSAQIEGRDMRPLLADPRSAWEDRTLVHHVGRWKTGEAAAGKHVGCSIQNGRWSLVKNNELYDLKNDPGEKHDVAAEHPEVVGVLRTEYDRWWDAVQARLVNENVVGPKENPFKTAYLKQFGALPAAPTGTRAP